MQTYFVRDLDYTEAKNPTPGDRSPDNPFWFCRSCHEPGRLAGIDFCNRCARHRMNRRYRLAYRYRKSLPHDPPFVDFEREYAGLRTRAFEHETCPCCRTVIAHRYGIAPCTASNRPVSASGDPGHPCEPRPPLAGRGRSGLPARRLYERREASERGLVVQEAA